MQCLMFNLKCTCISTSDEQSWNIIKWELSWKEKLAAIIILEFSSPKVSIILGQMIKYTLYVEIHCSYYEPLIIKKDSKKEFALRMHLEFPLTVSFTYIVCHPFFSIKLPETGITFSTKWLKKHEHGPCGLSWDVGCADEGHPDLALSSCLTLIIHRPGWGTGESQYGQWPREKGLGKALKKKREYQVCFKYFPGFQLT